MINRHSKKKSCTSTKNHRRIHTETDEQLLMRPSKPDTRRPEKVLTRPKQPQLPSKISVKEAPKKPVFKISQQRPGIADRYMRTEPDEKRLAGVSHETHQQADSKFKVQGVTGKGTFGVVYVGVHRDTGQRVAIKKVLQDKKYKNRELQILKTIRHPCLIEMKASSITAEGDQEFLNIVMDYYPEDLFKVIKKKDLLPLQVKLFSFQIFRGLNYLAMLSIAHRDIKPQNILIDRNTNRAVICDFGSAKVLVKSEPNLAYICSRCYRAPELIFGATDYTTQIDVWSVGCVMAEMINGHPPFIGESQIHQLVEIIKILGTPSRQQVLEMNREYDMTEYDKIPSIKPTSWQSLLKIKDPLFIDFVQKVVTYSPRSRLTPAQAMAHQYFNDLRDETKLASYGAALKNIPELFNFSEDEISFLGPLAPQILPQWTRGRNLHERKLTNDSRATTKRSLISTKAI